jgi:hypothetical protein
MAVILPDHIVNKIADPAERKRHVTACEADERYARDTEREMHSLFSSYCALHGIRCVHANPVKKSTIAPGWPDWSCFGPGARILFIEMKVRPNVLTPLQEEVKAGLEALGFRYVVAYSLVEAIYAAQQHFELRKAAQ